MRYVMLALLGVVSVVLQGSFVAGLNIAGIQVDIVLLIIVALALAEKTSMPVIFAALTGFFTDLLYTTYLGPYAISYTLVAIAVLMVFKNRERVNPFLAFLAGGGGYLLKEIVMGMLIYALGARFSFMSMLARYILPAALLAGGLEIVAYLLVAALMNRSWMKPRALHKYNDF